MFTAVFFKSNTLAIVDFLMDVGSTGGFIALTGFEPELITETTERSRMEANASWATFNYFVRYLVVLEADMIAQTPSEFQTLKIDMLQALMPPPDFTQDERNHGTLTIHPVGEAHNWELPVQIKSPPKFIQPAISPSAASFQITFSAFRPYWHRVVSDDYKWYL